MILLYVSANSYIINFYLSYAASAIAAKTLMQSEIGVMVPLFVTPMFHNMVFQWAGFLLARLSILISPIPFVFYSWLQNDRPVVMVVALQQFVCFEGYN